MPIMIKEPSLEERLQQHAKRMPVPTTKGRLLVALGRQVVETADAEGRDCSAFLEELRDRQRKAQQQQDLDQPTAA